jgi:hypothetical protein
MKMSRVFATLSLARSSEIEASSGDVETDELADPACALLSE